MIEFLIGVDGGGSGTRARLAHPATANATVTGTGTGSVPDTAPDTPAGNREPVTLGIGTGGPSGLSLGIANAWAAVEQAIASAFAAAGLPLAPRPAIALGLGLAGVHNQQWAAQFIAANPGYRHLALASDGHTTVLGAHGGAAGAIIALGTGSVGEVKLADGRHVEVGGWGFPSGDEAGGAWIGLHAINYMQQSLDGRLPANAFADAVAHACGAAPGSRQDPAAREILQQWLAGASQTSYAQLAPVVLRHAPSDDAARAILHAAGLQVERLAHALDAGGTLPIALCGGLAAPLRDYLPPALLARVVPAHADSAAGALRLIGQHLHRSPHQP